MALDVRARPLAPALELGGELFGRRRRRSRVHEFLTTHSRRAIYRRKVPFMPDLPNMMPAFHA
jgi:hypothetical protein